MSVQLVLKREDNLYEDADLAFLQNINYGCRIGMVWLAGSIMIAGSAKIIDDPICRIGAQFLILGGTLVSNYIVTTHVFSTQLK